jgi:hypothetical protein
MAPPTHNLKALNPSPLTAKPWHLTKYMNNLQGVYHGDSDPDVDQDDFFGGDF